MGKPSIKEFLKPDWRKLMILVIIFIVFSIIPIWTTIRCSTWECMPGPTMSSFFDSLESMKNKEFFDFGYFAKLYIFLLYTLDLR
jgi:hypothetical protein